MTAWWLLPIAIASSLALTGALGRFALQRRLLDIPNARSSHTVPTPRTGGLAIVATYLALLIVLVVAGQLPRPFFWSVVGAGSLVAVAGFIDDLRHVPPRWRLLAHFGAAIWVLAWLGAPQVVFLGVSLDGGWVAFVVGAFLLVWLLNLYNFMDGIDGIAGVEAICVCAGAAVLQAMAGHHDLAMASLLLAAATLGFLGWNFPKARVFMGDAGSGFLGIVIGALMLVAGARSPDLFWSWLILLGAFVADATVTLFRRLLRGEKVHEAHRSHAYQHAARRYGSHVRVTLAVALIDLLWLLPIAAWVTLGGLDGLHGVLIAYVPLVALALWLRAGQAERREA